MFTSEKKRIRKEDRERVGRAILLITILLYCDIISRNTSAKKERKKYYER